MLRRAATASRYRASTSAFRSPAQLQQQQRLARLSSSTTTVNASALGSVCMEGVYICCNG